MISSPEILFVTATTCPVLFAVYMQVCFARRITPAQYKDESVQYTQQAVRALRESPEYKQHVQRCKRYGIGNRMVAARCLAWELTYVTVVVREPMRCRVICYRIVWLARPSPLNSPSAPAIRQDGLASQTNCREEE